MHRIVRVVDAAESPEGFRSTAYNCCMFVSQNVIYFSFFPPEKTITITVATLLLREGTVHPALILGVKYFRVSEFYFSQIFAECDIEF